MPRNPIRLGGNCLAVSIFGWCDILYTVFHQLGRLDEAINSAGWSQNIRWYTVTQGCGSGSAFIFRIFSGAGSRREKLKNNNRKIVGKLVIIVSFIHIFEVHFLDQLHGFFFTFEQTLFFFFNCKKLLIRKFFTKFFKLDPDPHSHLKSRLIRIRKNWMRIHNPAAISWKFFTRCVFQVVNFFITGTSLTKNPDSIRCAQPSLNVL